VAVTLKELNENEHSIALFDVSSKWELAKIVVPGKNLTKRVQIPVFDFSPDGRLVALCGSDAKVIHLIEIATGKERFLLAEHPEPVFRLAFSPGGQTLASGCVAGVVRFWNVASGAALRTLPARDGRVHSLAFSPDGKNLAVGGADSQILVWDAEALVHRVPIAQPGLTSREIQELWTDLVSDDARRAGRAIERLSLSPKQAVTFLKSRLHPTEVLDRAHVELLLADLDSSKFAIREQATKELELLDERATDLLRKVLENKPTLEMRRRVEAILKSLTQKWFRPSPERLQGLRSLEVLERIGGSDACQALEQLAGGAAGARLTQEARGALTRLAKETNSERLPK
jgi:WD domain, G-beta repeat